MTRDPVTMTVYKIESELIDVTPFGEHPRSRFLPGRVLVSAQGEGEHHQWELKNEERCWLGDRVHVRLTEVVA